MFGKGGSIDEARQKPFSLEIQIKKEKGVALKKLLN
jgi:hypothetical protein